QVDGNLHSSQPKHSLTTPFRHGSPFVQEMRPQETTTGFPVCGLFRHISQQGIWVRIHSLFEQGTVKKSRVIIVFSVSWLMSALMTSQYVVDSSIRSPEWDSNSDPIA